jgi:hypothetical protein
LIAQMVIDAGQPLGRRRAGARGLGYAALRAAPMGASVTS